ncbi:hypothetical protein AB0M02_10175 [Actinoplanes sp. NPDC051861]|uniref:hypothetical protein n=1 Tax=Actinoplanes sp. NPDC051861 TaxID=3155170 RepID=UPI00343AB09A
MRTNETPDTTAPWAPGPDNPAAPDTSPWTPVPFEPASPRAVGVDAWGSPPASGWGSGNRVVTGDWTASSEDSVVSGGWAALSGASGAAEFAAGRSEPTVWADSPAQEPPRKRGSRLVTVGMTLLGAVALAALALVGVVYYSGPDTEIGEMLQLGNGGGDQRTASGPLDGRTVATFELLAATDRVKVTIADLNDELYRITAPEGAGIEPNAELKDDRLLVDLARDQAGAGGEIEVVLAAKVRWTLRFSGYAAERVVDLSDGRIDGIELVGGTRRAEVTLAEAAGTVPMKITGSIEELTLRAPADNPVRVKVGGGASAVTAGARTLRDLPPGSTLTPKDWQKANRYDVDAASAIAVLKVEERKS